ncbi:MAG: polysaccharide biosynthesis protein [Gammaproteobacteria bacterium]|nr:polysaccharide biosynthesis protein [Gammaproteobacteria bacterium]
MVPLAWTAAYWLRFNLGDLPPDYYDYGLRALLIILPVQLIAFAAFGLYRGVWRFASLPDLLKILKSVIIGTAIAMVLLFVITRAEGVPRSVPVIYTLLLISLLAGPRLIYRWFKDRRLYLSPGQRVLIAGSGKAGEMLARDILRNPQNTYRPVAFVDDNPRRLGRDIQGLRVVGDYGALPDLTKKLDIDIIMLAMPSATSAQMRRVVGLCEQAGVPFRSVPQLHDLMTGNVRINELREVSIEDLLGRDPVSLDWPAIQAALAGKTILVTGGGGSIGSELCRQLAQLKPSRLVILDHSEFNLYQIQMEMIQQFPELELQCHLGDVTDRPCVDDIFMRHHPDVVFHAAAYKHVPMLEPQIRSALRNNFLGTRNVAEVADAAGCGIFVLVSTDKAVNPANVMGASKRAAEIFCQNFNDHSKTRFITVRFGNVLGSAGSVIPLFRRQIAEGGPVTVTDPRMERYFMTIPEACQLIMQTVVLGKGGEIYVLDMGEPVKISYLAEQMIRLSGKIPGEDVRIEYIGLRPGEKLYEELFHEKERLEATAHEKVLLARHRKVSWEALKKSLCDIETACDTMDDKVLKELLFLLVPEQDQTAVHTTGNESAAKVVYLKS